MSRIKYLPLLLFCAALFQPPCPALATETAPAARGGSPQEEEIGRWLERQSPEQRARASEVIESMHERIHELRLQILARKWELENFSYDQNTTPESLPRIGRELQRLRRRLASLLADLDRRLLEEAGIALGPLGKTEYWFSGSGGACILEPALPDQAGDEGDD